MKKKICIVSTNKLYLNRLMNSFINFYSNEYEMYSFLIGSFSLEAFNLNHFDLIIADEGFEVDNLPCDTTLVYLTNKRDKDLISEIPAIYMYQKVDSMYIRINDLSERKVKNNDLGRVHAFYSPKGGVGTTNICMAFFTKEVEGDKAFYLNLETFEDLDYFFSEEGINLEEFILLMKINEEKALTLLEKEKKKMYFSTTKNVLNKEKIRLDEYISMIKMLKSKGYILYLDLGEIHEEIIVSDIIDHLYIISDGTLQSNIKNERFINYVREVNKDFLDSTSIIFNKVNPGYIEEDFGLKIEKYFDEYSFNPGEKILEALNE